MDLAKYHHTDSVTVHASPDAVYDLVSDVTRIGEFSPVCKSAHWTDDDRTTFTGDNVTPEMSWTTHCQVVVDAPGEEFTFVNRGMDGQRELVRWSYTFAAEGDGCVVTESWQVLPGYGEFMHSVAPDMDVEAYLDGVVPKTKEGMAATLAAIKATAEK